MLCRDSFFFLVVETLRLLCYSWAHPLCFSYRLQRSFIFEFLLRIVFLHWTKLGDSSSPLAITQRSLRILWQTRSMVSGSFTVSCISSPPINTWSNGSDYIAISPIAISGFLMSIFFDMSNSQSPMPLHWLESTVQIWSWFNGCDLSRDIAYREIEIPVAMFLWHFQNTILKTPTWCPSADITRGLTCVEYCHMSLWFVTYMCLKCWISLTLVITWLCHVFLADVVYWRELGRQSISYLLEKQDRGAIK